METKMFWLGLSTQNLEVQGELFVTKSFCVTKQKMNWEIVGS